MHIKIPKKAAAPTGPDPKVVTLLTELKATQDKINKLRRKHAELFEQFDELYGDEKRTTEAIRAVMKQRVSKLTKEQTREPLVRAAGLSVRVRMSTIYDADALVKLKPAVLKTGAVSFSISAQEMQRLVAAKLVTEKEMEAVTTHRPSILIETDAADGFTAEGVS